MLLQGCLLHVCVIADLFRCWLLLSWFVFSGLFACLTVYMYLLVFVAFAFRVGVCLLFL